MAFFKPLAILMLAMMLANCSSGHSDTHQPKESQWVTLEENYPGFCHIDGKVFDKFKGYVASGYAMVDAGIGKGVQWKVDAGDSNSYTLEWRYSAAEDLKATVSANGRRNTTLTFPATGGWDQWKTVYVNLKLDKGLNDIVLTAATDKGFPYVDSLTVTGKAIAAVNCDGTPVPPYNPNPRCVAGSTFTDEVVDCGGARVGLSCGRGEDQPPVITLENATVKNLRIAADGGSDGIWCTKGDCTLENVIWEDVCEDAATQKSTSGSTMTIIGGWTWNNGGGKIIQHNAKETTVIVTGGFTMKGQNAKLLRACGNCVDNGGPKRLILDNVRIEGKLLEEIVGPNVNYGDVATVRNLFIKDYKPGEQEVCAEWLGYEKSEKISSKRLGEAWNTPACDISPSDITSF